MKFGLKKKKAVQYVGMALFLVSERIHVSVGNCSELFHFAPFCLTYVKYFFPLTQNSYVFVAFKEQVDSVMHIKPPTYEV